MYDSAMKQQQPRDLREIWSADNARGLALAADGDWQEAVEAFEASADTIARATADISSHEALALVLSNLSQACFRVGRTADAIQHAQRCYALRVAIAGEDAMVVARTRTDLAVLLGSVGRLDEAQSLVQRAIAGMEHGVGDDDMRLVIVLENAARLALAAGSSASAEPHLLRLHALLEEHRLPTTRADDLLERVAQSRRPSMSSAETAADVIAQQTLITEPDHDEAAVYEPVSIREADEWEDQPLRDAVVMTDILLRSTPSGVPIIQSGPGAVEPFTDESFEIELLPLDAAVDESELESVSLLDDIGMGMDFELADDIGAAPTPTPTRPADTPSTSPPPMLLGFEVEHGIGSILADSLTPLGFPAVAEPPAPGRDVLDLMPTTVDRFAEPPASTEPPTPPVTSSTPPAAPEAARLDPTKAAREVVHDAPAAKPVSRTVTTEHVTPAPTSTGEKKTGLIAGVVAAAAAAGAAAWWFLLR